jgi:hypothetical protein
MTKTEYDALVAKLDPNDRRILAEAQRLGTPATVAQLRPVTIGAKTGKPLAYGLTRELGRLQTAGLLRLAGKNPSRYAAVPLSEVEDAAERFANRNKRRVKRKSKRSRMIELRGYEHGDYAEFYRVYRRLMELGEYVGVFIPKMAYWEAAPKDDLAQIATELVELHEAVSDAMQCLKERADDDELLAKIEKLEAENGRTGAELESFRATAQRLRRQYEQRIGV